MYTTTSLSLDHREKWCLKLPHTGALWLEILACSPRSSSLRQESSSEPPESNPLFLPRAKQVSTSTKCERGNRQMRTQRERETDRHTRSLTICDARMGPTLGTHVTCSEFYSSRRAGRQHGRKEEGRRMNKKERPTCHKACCSKMSSKV